jgi:hypothetical protein
VNRYWDAYARTLDRIRAERPTTFAQLQVILDSFSAPSAADAFFPDGADDTLMAALQDAGWRVSWADAYYHYGARCVASGAQLEYVEGDVYDRTDKPMRAKVGEA